MKNLLSIIALVVVLFAGHESAAQKPKKVKLEQNPGVFKQTELKLKAGKTYIFEVANNGVDHPIGFVVAPKGKPEQENHIPEAYLTNTVEEGGKGTSKEVVLEKGEYIYFCPLNPTPQYTLVVE
ncbi:MAG: cupredoxin domain-containing protein [Cyclobacteriaceae bacterium]